MFNQYFTYCATGIVVFAQQYLLPRAIEHPKRDEYWNRLVSLQITAPEDREGFGRYFTNTARTFAAPRPGIECTFVWHLDEAERLAFMSTQCCEARRSNSRTFSFDPCRARENFAKLGRRRGR